MRKGREPPTPPDSMSTTEENEYLHHHWSTKRVQEGAHEIGGQVYDRVIPGIMRHTNLGERTVLVHVTLRGRQDERQGAHLAVRTNGLQSRPEINGAGEGAWDQGRALRVKPFP